MMYPEVALRALHSLLIAEGQVGLHQLLHLFYKVFACKGEFVFLGIVHLIFLLFLFLIFLLFLSVFHLVAYLVPDAAAAVGFACVV